MDEQHIEWVTICLDFVVALKLALLIRYAGLLWQALLNKFNVFQ